MKNQESKRLMNNGKSIILIENKIELKKYEVEYEL